MYPRQMMLRSMRAVLLVSFVLAVSCTSSEERPPNDGEGKDAGVDAGVDAGADAGVDAGTDAGPDPSVIDVSPVAPAPTDSGLGADWYRKGAFMEIYVRGFKDSNGDGIGDFKGLTQSLDYLKDLGITGLWLMPMMRSCDRDHGYAVCDYRKVEPDYGTLADFDELVTQAHQRGLGIIIDYVMNHSGQENALFQSSAGSASSPFRSWYVWQDVKPGGWTNWSGTDTWSANSLGPGYYYSVFWSGMPDFNLQHPAAFAYHLDNLRFWLNRGVDGFRFDAVEVLTETDSTRWSNQPASYSLLKQARELIESYPHRYMVCEAPGDPDRAAGNNACRGAFAFNLSSTLKEAARGSGMASAVSAFPTQHPIGGLATLLSNHDPFAGERPYTFFSGDEAQARLAAASLLTLPGVPFLYYGEEVGMSNNSTYGGSDWRLRVPMSWTADTATAGFTTGVPFRRPADNVATHNVALEQSDPDSMFSYYKRLLNLRRTSRSLRMGLYEPLTVNEPTGNVLAFLRRYGSEATLVVINYDPAVSSFSLTLGSPFNGATFNNLFPEVTGTLTADNQGTLALDIPSQSVRIYRAAVGGNLPYPGATLYIRGEMTDWNATNAMIYVGGGLYQGSFHLTARDTPYLFKIADANWAPYNFGAIGSQAVTPGVPVQLEQTAWNNGGVGHDLLLLVSQDGDYTLTLDGSNPVNPRLTVTQ